MQSSSHAHLGPFALVRALLHFNKPSQLTPLKQGLKDCKEAKAREGISAQLFHSPFSEDCHTHQFIHPSNKQTNRTCHPSSQGCVTFKSNAYHSWKLFPLLLMSFLKGRI